MGFATLAIFLLFASATSPALANGSAHSRLVAVSLVGLPDTCPTDAVMEGKLTIQLLDTSARGSQLVTLEVTAETPFGEALVFTKSARMKAGSQRVVPIDIPVEQNAQVGTYVLHFTVSVKGDEVTVDHTVQIYRW
jgi:hypothetical protein